MIELTYANTCACDPKCTDRAEHALNLLNVMAGELRAGELRKQWDLSECKLLVSPSFQGVVQWWPISHGGTRLGRMSIAPSDNQLMTVNYRGAMIASVQFT